MAEATPSKIEVVCTLNDEEFRQRRTWVRHHIGPHLISIEKTNNGLSLTYPSTPDVEALVEEFAALERQCCGGFLEFTLESRPNKEQFDLMITGPDEAQPMLLDLKSRIEQRQLP